MYENDAVAAPPQAPQDPAAGAGAEANTPELCAKAVAESAAVALGAPEEPLALVVVAVTRNRITVQAALHMGGHQLVQRRWDRVDNHGSSAWSSRDPEFIAHEERIGIELAEFADAIDLPDRVANMLPRAPKNPDCEARRQAAAAAEELRHG